MATARKTARKSVVKTPARRAHNAVTEVVALKNPLKSLAPEKQEKPAGDKGLMTLARDLRSWTGFVLGIANTAADLSFRVASSRLTKPSHKAAVDKVGSRVGDAEHEAGPGTQVAGQAHQPLVAGRLLLLLVLLRSQRLQRIQRPMQCDDVGHRRGRAARRGLRNRLACCLAGGGHAGLLKRLNETNDAT